MFLRFCDNEKKYGQMIYWLKDIHNVDIITIPLFVNSSEMGCLLQPEPRYIQGLQ